MRRAVTASSRAREVTMTSARRALGAGTLVGLIFAACGGGSGGGAPAVSASPPASAPALAPRPLSLVYEIRPGVGVSSAALSWSGFPEASDYVIEVGSASGAADVGQIVTSGAQVAHVLEGLPAGRTFFVRVRGRGASGLSLPSNEVRVLALDLRDVIEALYLGSGALTPRDGSSNCVARERWVAFPRGASVRVRISATTVSEAAQRAVQQAVAQWVAAVGADVTAVVELTGDADPQPEENEITVATHPDPPSQGCTFERGCTIVHVRGGLIFSARAILGPSIARANAVAAYPHDAVGHGGLGTCHIDGVLMGGARQSLMGGGPDVFSCTRPSDTCIATNLTALDSEAARAVYQSGLARGADRAALARAGLIRPGSVAAAAPTRAPRRLRVSPLEEIVILDHD